MILERDATATNNRNTDAFHGMIWFVNGRRVWAEMRQRQAAGYSSETYRIQYLTIVEPTSAAAA